MKIPFVLHFKLNRKYIIQTIFGVLAIAPVSNISYGQNTQAPAYRVDLGNNGVFIKA